MGQGAAARTLTLDLPPFTLVGATTRTGLLTSPLRDRFGMTFRLDYYEPDELAQIVVRSARILGVAIAAEAADEIAGRARGTPRIANRILRRVRDVAEVRHEGSITTAIAREALELLEVDEAGLERLDRDLLRAIVEKYDGGPVGVNTLAASLGEEPETIEYVYEPYLLQLGFIARTPRGRTITSLGRAHIGGPPRRGCSRQPRGVARPVPFALLRVEPHAAGRRAARPLRFPARERRPGWRASGSGPMRAAPERGRARRRSRLRSCAALGSDRARAVDTRGRRAARGVRRPAPQGDPPASPRSPASRSPSSRSSSPTPPASCSTGSSPSPASAWSRSTSTTDGSMGRTR